MRLWSQMDVQSFYGINRLRRGFCLIKSTTVVCICSTRIHHSNSVYHLPHAMIGFWLCFTPSVQSVQSQTITSINVNKLLWTKISDMDGFALVCVGVNSHAVVNVINILWTSLNTSDRRGGKVVKLSGHLMVVVCTIMKREIWIDKPSEVEKVVY